MTIPGKMHLYQILKSYPNGKCRSLSHKKLSSAEAHRGGTSMVIYYIFLLPSYSPLPQKYCSECEILDGECRSATRSQMYGIIMWIRYKFDPHLILVYISRLIRTVPVCLNSNECCFEKTGYEVVILLKVDRKILNCFIISSP